MRLLSTPNLLIVGASARAATFSALRAGLQPWGADLFNDADLIARCPCLRLPARQYPGGLVKMLQTAPQAPWIYTGALENRPALIRTLSRLRPLWGNGSQVLRQVRSPFVVEKLLRDRQLACPRHQRPGQRPPPEARWLVKPLAGAGGRGIGWWSGPEAAQTCKVYLQEYVEGDSCAAVYIGDGTSAVLFGVTHQLTGEPWLHALPFHYCGSVGPLALADTTRAAFDRLGHVLAAGFQLRGVFGVDCILHEGVPYPVEINPRYTASVEVLEYATGVSALALHRDACAGGSMKLRLPSPRQLVGKAVPFARDLVVFPATGPWWRALQSRVCIHELPEFADIPNVGTRMWPHQPILTFFTQGDSVVACVDQLRQIARDLDRWLNRR
jgi:predicted ATP-grasp superfamily ATP-dependent carboligase